MDGHYDRVADIAWLCRDGWDAGTVRVEQAASGLIERDRDTRRVVGPEYWEVSPKLPGELLGALPAPPHQDALVERQPA